MPNPGRFDCCTISSTYAQLASQLNEEEHWRVMCRLFDAICKTIESGPYIVRRFGTDCKYMCHCINNSQCDYVNGSCESGCDGGWSGPGCQYRNPAFARFCRHIDNTDPPFYCGLAIDNDDTSCSTTATATNRTQPPWWRVYLPHMEYISELTILTNSGSLYYMREFEVYVENVSESQSNITNYIPKNRVQCYKHGNETLNSTEIHILCDTPGLGNQVRIQLRSPDTQLVLCDVKINGGRNIAFQGIVSMTDLSPFSPPVNNTVDGILRYNEWNSCSATKEIKSGTDQWWMIEFGNVVKINQISISPIEGRLENYQIVILDDKGHSVKVYDDAGNWPPVKTVTLTLLASNLMILRQKVDRLALCEVLIFGDCPSGACGFQCEKQCHCKQKTLKEKNSGDCSTVCEGRWTGNDSKCDTECTTKQWGKLCSNLCGNCKNSEPCDFQTGACPNGCHPGIQETYDCKNECLNGMYGYNCSKECGHCRNNFPCNKTTGDCEEGCAPGWIGNTCDECNHGTYGDNCQLNCTQNCVNGSVCSNIDGHCPGGCREGYMEEICDKECLNGTYGYNCSKECGHCRNNFPCNKTTGACEDDCALGWTGSTCDTECDQGTYGDNCLLNCTHNCVNDSVCSNADGHCHDGCREGYMGRICDEECKQGTFGENCKLNCTKNCANDSVCSNSDGHCPGGCIEGYMGKRCDAECRNGTYGYNCSKECGRCRNNFPCNKTNGVCEDGCASGWIGNTCDLKCDNGYFGTDCNSTCSHYCIGICHHVNGFCEKGCEDGWIGSDCTQSQKGEELDNSSSAGIISAVLVLIVFLVSVIGLIYWKRNFIMQRCVESSTSKKKKLTIEFTNKTFDDESSIADVDDADDKVKSEESTDDTNNCYANEGDAVYSNIPQYTIRVVELANLLKTKHEDDFQEQFSNIPYGLNAATLVAKKEENIYKNKYKEVYAYDHSRVKLKKTLKGQDTSDYINASYVKGYIKNRAYIAAQGPIEETVEDFWRMIWEKDVRMIIMLTNITESGKSKCLQYWGALGETLQYEKKNVTLTLEEVFAEFTIRHLEVKNQNDIKTKRNVVQYHYTAWLDKGVPKGLFGLLHFWRRVRQNDENKDHTWLVHCSAGVGRTGTFIATDILYERGLQTGYINVHECVTDLRVQRANMVQTKEQYVLLYRLMADLFCRPLQPIKVDDFAKHFMAMSENDSETGQTKLFHEYENIQREITSGNVAASPTATSTSVKGLSDDLNQKIIDRFTTSKLPENTDKNRLPDILASDEHRPILSTFVAGCTNYINAVVIPSYEDLHGYIITQLPLANTTIDCYRLIVERGIELIVTFADEREDMMVPDYLPDAGSLQCGPFIISFESEAQQSNFVLKKYTLQYQDKKQLFIQLVYKDWPSDEIIPRDENSMLRLIAEIHRQKGQSERRPILLQCWDGAERSGLLVTLMNIIEFAKYDNEVSIPQIVRHLKTRREQIISNCDQYKFCYEVICRYLERTTATYANMDGAERSGLLVTLMNIIEFAKYDNEVSIPQIVRHLKTRREQIISNCDQYKFCYEVICRYLERTTATYANM